MKQVSANLPKRETFITGDPFTDSGNMVIDYLYHLPAFKNKSLIELITFMADVYVFSWGAHLHPFLLNSTITQPAYDNNRKIKETINYYEGLIKETLPHRMGHCMITGKKTALFKAKRDNYALSGSDSFVNFHPVGTNGLYLSKEVLIAHFFVPFGIQRLADKISLIYSNDMAITRYFVSQNCLANMTALNTKQSTSALKSIFNNPANALFSFIDEYHRYIKDSINREQTTLSEGTTVPAINLYHWSNLGQKPEIRHYYLDAKIFQFYTWCQEYHYENWQLFLKAHANPGNFKKVAFDETTGQWLHKDGTPMNFEDYAKLKNLILHNLLHERPLRYYFLKWCRGHIFPFELISEYQIQIRQMKQGTLDKITEIAAFIGRQGLEYAKKNIAALDRTVSKNEFRQVLLKIIKEGFSQKLTLVTTKEYDQYLFPDDGYPGYWWETRDMLIIAVYQHINQ